MKFYDKVKDIHEKAYRNTNVSTDTRLNDILRRIRFICMEIPLEEEYTGNDSQFSILAELCSLMIRANERIEEIK